MAQTAATFGAGIIAAGGMARAGAPSITAEVQAAGVSRAGAGRAAEVGEEAISRVYRVQGGSPPRASRVRIVIGESEEMQVIGRQRLYVTFDDAGRARVFRDNNRPGGEIISFEVDPMFVRQVREAAIPEAQGQAFPNAPQIADPMRTTGSYGLPAEWIDRLMQAARPGTGRIER